MIDTNLKVIFLAFGVATIVGTLLSLRREHIRTEYSISWLGFGVLLSLLSLWPGLLDAAARAIGADPQTCFLILGGSMISGLVFEISHVVSKLRDENVLLAQRLAILDYRLRRSELEHGKNQNGQTNRE